MNEILVRGKTLPEAYHKALLSLNQFGEICDCENQTEISRQKECSMTMVVEEPLSEPMISRLWIGGAYDLERYRQEILDGILDHKIGDGWDYTYHDRMSRFPMQISHGSYVAEKNQIDFVVDDLKRCKYSRRAVISLRTAEDMSVFATDPACLQHIQYFIRNGKLHCKVLFRSNDAAEATFMNAFAFIQLQKQIAEKLGVEMGSYTHRANSFHVYEKDFKLLEGYCNRISSGKDLTYNYVGFFDDMMEEEKENVALLIDER